MSRTIRRKNYVPKWVTSDLVWVPNGDSRRLWGTYIQVPLEGKSLKKSLAKHHGDHGYNTLCASGNSPGKCFRTQHQKAYRVQSRQELHKYLCDDEYECMILANPKLPYWD